MNRLILNTAVQDYIYKNLAKNHAEVALKGSPFPEVPIAQLLEQIVSKSKAQQKLPTWFQTENIYYPNKLNIEQTSSEITANYKAQLVSGDSLIDITGGFGVDSYYFSNNFKSVAHCEINQDLHEIAAHNFNVLNKTNIKTICSDGIKYIKSQDKNFDCIYADPSRRHNLKGKVFMLKDCEPDIPENLDILLNYAPTILIKTSPLLDINLALKELKHVMQIHAVAVDNEVKELLWLISKNNNNIVKVITANIKSNYTEYFEFNLHDENQLELSYSEPLTYLYEPNAAIMKSGAFKSIAVKLGVEKLDQHTHLYTSNNLVEFPGRVFKINQVVPFSKSTLKSLHINKANITTRNFPIDVKSLREKFKIEDGGERYLFFTTIFDNKKVVLICEKLSQERH
ncbi:class I SAM-dependent methyltransferase [Paucihalobacter ruber]|uniref:Class I SAM-dependent methyltransferase n=1 Tax=Paucihalobacter ruber TaxID=2567861 RepID=A0A506PJD9_9FLAO|nr:class I SAM-dependent methyltransferase [Paucihalobacter ruber]